MAATYNLLVDQGGELDITFSFKDPTGVVINLSGCTAKAQIAAAYGGAPVVTLVATSGLTLGGTAGTIGLVITAAQTSALIGGNQYVWDMLVTDTLGVPRRYVQGSVLVSPRVTT